MPDADDFPRCESCDHFHNDPEYRDLDGVCRIAESDYGEAVHDTPVTAQDYESYRAFLEVDKDYGCVLHSSLQSEDD